MNKEILTMNEEILLSDTKITKDLVQDILDVDPTEQSAQRIGGRPQLLGGEFLALLEHRHAALQRSHGLLQQFALPLPADQATLLRAEIFLRKPDQRRRSIPRSHRPGCAEIPNSSCPAAAPRRRAPGVEIDLVAYRPDRRAAAQRILARAQRSTSHNTRSASAARALARRTPSCSTGSSVSRMPAVSITVTG